MVQILVSSTCNPLSASAPSVLNLYKVCVHTCVCVYTCVCSYMCVCIYMRVVIHTYIFHEQSPERLVSIRIESIYIHMCVCVYMRMYICVCVYTCVRTSCSYVYLPILVSSTRNPLSASAPPQRIARERRYTYEQDGTGSISINSMCVCVQESARTREIEKETENECSRVNAGGG